MKVKQLLNNEAAQVLSEESVQSIEAAFKEKADLMVEAALTQQDDLYAAKLDRLIEAIDKDHTAKLKTIVNSIDQDRAKKLKRLIEKHNKEVGVEAKRFKSVLVEQISNYLEEFLNEAIPANAISQATKNKTAIKVLSGLRKVLAVDSAIMSESVKEGLLDGKQRIDILEGQVQQLSKENKILKEGYNKTKAALVLESKTAGLSDKKKEYIKRVLGDKSPAFINENFDYTLKLFERKESERLDILKEEAYETRKVKADAPVFKEKVLIQPQPSNPQRNIYLKELERAR